MSWLWASFPDRGWGIADGPRQLTQVEASNKLLKWDEKGGRGRDCGGEEGMDNDLREGNIVTVTFIVAMRIVNYLISPLTSFY